MTLKYDEFFVTPAGTVEIRRFLRGKKGKFEQSDIGRNGQLLPGVFEQLEEQDGWSLNLWNEVQLLLEQFPYPAHAYVFGISKDREVPNVTIEFQIATEESGLDPSEVRCWKPKGPKRWGWQTPTTDIEVASCISSSFEDKGVDVGGGYQVTYFPITLTVTGLHDAKVQLSIADRVFAETGIGPFILKPKPWSDAG